MPSAAAAGEAIIDPVAEPITDPVAEPQSLDEVSGDLADDTYEYIDDTSGLEVEEPDEAEADAEPVAVASRPGNRQRRLDTSAAAAVSARKWRRSPSTRGCGGPAVQLLP